MVLKKAIIGISLIAVLAVPAFSYAETANPAVLKADLTDAIARLISRYEARISELETENAALRTQLVALKGTGALAFLTTASTGAVSSPTASVAAPAKATTPVKIVATASGASTGNAEYDAVIQNVNAHFAGILKENSLSDTAELGLFEFVSGKRAFFVSIDDGKNPTGVTAFKTKILFSYDADYQTTVVGVFDLVYEVQKYRTVKGSNPYSGTDRIKVKNPAYKGKLLSENLTVSPDSAVSTSKTSTGVTITGDVTVKSIHAAYDKSKLADAIALATAYLEKNPNDIDILTVRYRSFFIKSRFTEALKDIQTIEGLQGANFDCTIARDATYIAKATKNADLTTKYGAYSATCKKAK